MRWERIYVEGNGIDARVWVSPEGKIFRVLPEWGVLELIKELDELRRERDELWEALQRCEKDHCDDVATMTRQLLSFETMWDSLRTLANRKNYFDPTFDAPAIALAAIDAAKGGGDETRKRNH